MKRKQVVLKPISQWVPKKVDGGQNEWIVVTKPEKTKSPVVADSCNIVQHNAFESLTSFEVGESSKLRAENSSLIVDQIADYTLAVQFHEAEAVVAADYELAAQIEEAKFSTVADIENHILEEGEITVQLVIFQIFLPITLNFKTM